ncbi:MAG: hypothetical protein PUP92_34340, partial [Rhizonema sp. PD38]|nr:hypothetical protein [Rhizonema sp. PD38]
RDFQKIKYKKISVDNNNHYHEKVGEGAAKGCPFPYLYFLYEPRTYARSQIDNLVCQRECVVSGFYKSSGG